MSTPNLAITHIAANQNSKEVTANAAFDALDGAIAGEFTAAISDNYTVSAANAAANLAFVFTGALSADKNIIVPAAKKMYVVKNSTTGGHTLTVKTSGGTGIALASADGYVMLYCDGVNVVSLKTV